MRAGDTLDSQIIEQHRRRGAAESPHFIQRTLIAPMLRRRRRRAAIAELEAMTDQLLADIGISRGEIPRVVGGLIAGDARATAPRTPSARVEELRERMRRAA